MKIKPSFIISAIQTALVLYLIALGFWRLNESGLDFRAFISFGLALGNLWFVIDRHS